MLEFRLLRADEIDARVSTITEKNVMLLLYKDARCDMNILDETVGPMNWQRKHSRENANCVVSIWDDSKQAWIEKEDTGVESNTEAEKGLASDSFKRSCVNWGIGRELYTAPNLFFPIGNTNTVKGPNGKPKCNDRFVVDEIEYDGRKIVYVKITDLNTRQSITVGRKKVQAVAGEVVNVRGDEGHQNRPVVVENGPKTDSAAFPDRNAFDEKKTAFLSKVKSLFDTPAEQNDAYKKIMQEVGARTFKSITEEQLDEAIALLEKMAAA